MQVKEAYNQLQLQYSDDPLVGTVLNYMYKRLLDAVWKLKSME